MKRQTTNRNFGIYSFKDSYDNECSLQKSSNVGEDYIWLGVDDSKPQILAQEAIKLGIKTEEVIGWIPYELPKEVSLYTRMHLSRKQVKELLPILQKFVKTGEI